MTFSPVKVAAGQNICEDMGKKSYGESVSVDMGSEQGLDESGNG